MSSATLKVPFNRADATPQSIQKVRNLPRACFFTQSPRVAQYQTTALIEH